MNKPNNAPHIEQLPVIGSIATMPSRADTFFKMLHGVLAQVDKLFVFLDGFDEIPLQLQLLPKCHITLLPKEASLHASSRFLAPRMFGSDAVVVMFDDDILYPPDYVATIKMAFSQYGDKVIVGFHGGIFVPPHRSYIRDMQSLHFAFRLKHDLYVHMLGCGTAAFISSWFKPDPSTWTHSHMDDLYLSAAAIQADMPLISLKREAKWLLPLAENQSDSLWQETKKDDSVQSGFMREIIFLYAKKMVEIFKLR